MSDETITKSEATTPGRRLTFDWLNRRMHLYLALALLPWFLVYGASSVFFSHPTWFEKAPPNKVLFERAYELEPIPADADLKPIGARIQKDAGLEGHFNVFRSPSGSINLWTTTFMKSTQVTYDPKNHTLKAENSVFRFGSMLTRLHTRGGFDNPGLLHQAWSIIVDLVQLAIVLWVISGFIMWWKLRRHRTWGLLATAAGIISFAIFMANL